MLNYGRLYGGSYRFFGNIDKSLGKGSKIKNDHDKENSQKGGGKFQLDFRHGGWDAGIGRPYHLQIVEHGNTGIDDRQNDQRVHVLFNCSGKQEKLSGKPDGGRDAGHAEGAHGQGEGHQGRPLV